MKKNIYKTIRFTTIIILFLLLTSHTIHAQIDLPDDDPFVPDAPAAPINGLIGLGLLTGIFLGVKKIKKK